MKDYSIGELAALAGVSRRTLHYYDEIGLLKPAKAADTGYRCYGEAELLRLQQILINRELGFSLGDIAALLDDPKFDRLAALERQRDELEQQAEHYRAMIATIDRTIARLRGEADMKDADLYSGFVAPEKQAEYEAWLTERYGDEMRDRIAASKRNGAGLSEADIATRMADLKQIEAGLAKAMSDGWPPQALALEPLIERHRRWVAGSWDKPCAAEAYGHLADVYEHPDFVARYEAIAAGFSRYLPAAMRAWARRHASVRPQQD